MATRFYLPSSGTPGLVPNNPAGMWEVTSSYVTLPMSPDKAGTAMSTRTSAQGSGTNPNDVLVAQFVSEPLSTQTLAGNFKGQIRVLENNSLLAARAQWLLRDIASNGNARTQMGENSSALSSEFATGTLTNRKFPLSAVSPVSIPSFSIIEGDRLVIEVGFRAHSTSATAAQFRFGDTGVDIGENEISTTDNIPWFEFSQTVSFYRTASFTLDAYIVQPTRFYAQPLGDASGIALPAPDANWTDTSQSTGDSLISHGHASALGITTTFNVASGTGRKSVLGYRMVSQQLRAQTIGAGGAVNFDGLIFAKESGAALDANCTIGLRAITPAGAVRGTLFAVDTTLATAGEMSATALAATEIPWEYIDNPTLNSVVVQEGDRLLFEIGFRSVAGSGTVQMRHRDGAATDLTGGTADANTWFQIDQRILFLGTGTFTLDAVRKAPASGSFTLSAWISKRGTFTLDAYKKWARASDTWTRTSASGWGNADEGGAWSAAFGGSSVNGTQGVITSTSASGGSQTLNDVGIGATDALVRVQVDKLPSLAGQTVQAGVSWRWIDVNHRYRCTFYVFNDHTVLELGRAVTGNSNLVLGSATTSVPAQVNTWYWVRVRNDLRTGNVQARVWLDGTPEPTVWTLDLADSVIEPDTIGGVSLRTVVTSASDGTVTFLWDDLLAVRATPLGAFTFDAVIRRTTTASFTLNAVIPAAVAGSFTLDALKRRTIPKTVTFDAWIVPTARTRFSLIDVQNLPFSTPVWSGWQDTSDVMRYYVRRQDAAPDGYSTVVSVEPTADVVLAIVWLTNPLSAQTISGLVRGQIRTQEGDSNNNSHIELSLRVIKPDHTERAELLAGNSGNPPSSSEFIAGVMTNRTIPNPGVLRAVTTTVIQEGDAIQIELGVHKRFIGSPLMEDNLNPLSATSNDFSLFKSLGAPDLPIDETTTSAMDSWFEFLSLLSFYQTGSFTLDAVVALTRSGSFTLAAVVKRTATPSFTLNAVLRQTQVSSTTLDAVVRRTPTGSATLNAVLFRTASASFTLAAIKRTSPAGSFTLNALFRRTALPSFALDAVVSEANVGSFALNAIVAGQTPGEGLFSLDAIIKGPQLHTLALSAVKRAPASGSFILSALRRVTIPGSFTANAVKRAPASGSFTLQATLAQTRSGTFSLQAITRRAVSASFTANAVKRAPAAGTFTLNATIPTGHTGTFAMDAIRRRTASGTVPLSAVVRKTAQGTTALNAVIEQTRTSSFGLNAWLRVTRMVGLSLDAVVLSHPTGAFSLRAVVRAPGAGSFTLDAFRRDIVVGSFTFDAWLTKTTVVPVPFDAIVLRTDNPGDYTLDAVITVMRPEFLEANLSARVLTSSIEPPLFLAASHETRMLAWTHTDAQPRSGTFDLEAEIV